ncbi:MAG: fumarylacetoacetate hydrolase family protein, partial [Ramlibacter sp.]
MAVLLLQGCAALPSLNDRAVSAAFQDTFDTHLGRTVAPLTQAHPGTSGVFALPQGIDAFAARGRLADVAERSLDVQYYIWHNDVSGGLLLDALRRAADRGVRVRLLLDDNNTGELGAVLPELIEHLSSVFTLEPGDVIATGTPSGVGFARKPPRFLKAG